MTEVNKTERTPEQIELIWKHTHKDMKGVSNGVKTIVYPAPYSCLGTVEDLPEDAYQDKLRYARYKECCEKRDEKLRPIMVEHGVIEHFDSTMQWRDELDDVAVFAGFTLQGEALEALLTDVKAADITYPKTAGLKYLCSGM
ncbi:MULTISPECIES: hypothetical protein [Vibrio]|nr:MULTISPECIES: hypothetical protein [Vibrio]MCS0096519.1 hypothetical protein [Vibrio cholerae]RZQ97203.1 hypothetical protein D8T25_19835 [Vibrio vulnificus]